MGASDWVMGLAILAVLVVLFLHTAATSHHPSLVVLTGFVVLLQVISMVREFSERSRRGQDARRNT